MDDYGFELPELQKGESLVTCCQCGRPGRMMNKSGRLETSFRRSRSGKVYCWGCAQESGVGATWQLARVGVASYPPITELGKRYEDEWTKYAESKPMDEILKELLDKGRVDVHQDMDYLSTHVDGVTITWRRVSKQ